jgi:tetratricopeptide (TPR) repeat protein
VNKKHTTDSLYSADYETIYAEGQRASRANDFAALAVAQDALAHYHWRRHDLRHARSVLNAAVDSLPVEYIRERLMLSNTLISVEHLSGRYQRVCDLSPRAINDAATIGDEYLRAQAYSNYAHALAELGEIDPAFDNYTSAHICFEGHPKQQARTDINTAKLLVKADEAARAFYYLDRAESFFRVEPHKSDLGQLYETRASAFLAENKLDEAMSAIDESLDLIPEDHRQIRAESYNTKGRIHELRGEELDARFCYTEAIRLLAEAEGAAS